MLSLPIILLVLFAGGVLLMDLVTPLEWKWMNAAMAFAGIVFSTAGVIKIQFLQDRLRLSGGRVEWAFGHSMLVDPLSIYFYYLFLISAAITISMLVGHAEIPRVKAAKVYSFILLTVVGMMLMAAGFDIVIIFAGLELMSASTYVLIRYSGIGLSAREKGLKYLRRGAFSSVIFACGLGLLYGLTGSTNLQLIAQGLKNNLGNHFIVGRQATVILALVVMVAGICFQIAAMPFHRRMLDICEAVPSAIAGFIVVGFQIAGWAMLLRILLWGMYSLRAEYVPILIFVSVLSMVGANIIALTQTRVSKLLAYSSIAHVGFMILGLISLTSVEYPAPAFFEGFKGMLIYLVAYAIANLGMFAVVGLTAQPEVMRNQNSGGMERISGLFYRAPVVAIFTLVFLFSLAGAPLFAGFYGKYFIVHSLFAGGRYILAILALASWLIAIYYYGRLGELVFQRDPNRAPVLIGVPASVALGTTAIFTIAAGIYPGPLLQAIEWSLRTI